MRNVLEQIPRLTIVGEEYPIPYLEGTSLDLLIEFVTSNNRYVLPIECKRAYTVMKRWVFFHDPEGNSKVLYRFHGKELNAMNATPFLILGMPVCLEGIEINLQKLDGQPYKAAQPDPIWKVGFQSCKGCLGFVRQELETRNKISENPPPDFITFSLLITNAELSVCNADRRCIDVQSGNYQGELPLENVPWLLLRHPFTPPESFGAKHLQVLHEGYANAQTRGFYTKEGIIVLNVSNIPRFFEMLNRLAIIDTQAPEPKKDATG